MQKKEMRKLKNPGISHECAAIVLGTCTFLLCAVILLNVFIELPLFIKGLNFIYDYQHAQPYGAIQVIENLISLLCNPIGIGTILFIYYIVVNRKLMLIVHLSYFLFATYFVHLLKQAFQQSRPIWYDDRIQNWEWFCPKDFGNPSGHSFAVSLLYEPIVSDAIGYDKYRLFAIGLLIICVLVPISRMYLGVHSANQILFGLTLGLIYLVLFKYVYQKALYELYWDLFMGYRKCMKLMGIFFLNIIILVVPIVFFEINSKERPMAEKDINNLNLQCGTNLTGLDVQVHMFTSCSIGCFAFGLIYGFVFLMDTPWYRKYLLGLWVHQTWTRVLIKIGIYLLCAGFPCAIFYAIGIFAVDNPIGKYFLYCLATFSAGIGLSYFAPLLTSRCKIMKLLPGPAQNYVDELDD